MGRRRVRGFLRFTACLALGTGGVLADSTSIAAALPHATKPLPRITITGRVLLGDAKHFSALGTVDRKTIFEAIPAIKLLRQEHVTRESARFHFLVFEANRVFQRALEIAASEGKVDLVVEQGGVTAAGIEVVDLTELTRRAVAARS